MTVASYRDLLVWQKAMGLAAEVYRLTETLPDRERFGLTNQARRTAVSIASRIAQGQGCGDTNEYVRSVRAARGVIRELETYILLTVRLGYHPEAAVESLMAQCAEVSRMSAGLARSLLGGSVS